MPVEIFKNTLTAGDSSTTVDSGAGYTDADTAIAVASAAAFPDPVFRVVNERTKELLKVTGKAGNTLTVERGAEGTTAAAMNDGDTLTYVVTVESLQAVATNPVGDEGVRSQGAYLYVVHRDDTRDAYLMGSADGVTFALLKTPRLYAPPAGEAQGDPSLLYHGGRYWVAHTCSAAGAEYTYFGLAVSDDLVNWTRVANVDCSGTGGDRTWAPEWFVDDDGSVHVFFSSGTASPGNMQIYRISPTSDDFSTWGTPTLVTVTGHTSIIDGFLVKKAGTYYLWYKDEANGFYTEYATSATLGGPYTAAVSGNWAGWGAHREGGCLVRLDADTWRIYLNHNSGPDSIAVYYSDSADDWATWSTPALIQTPWLVGHGTVLRVRDLPVLRNMLMAKLQDGFVTSTGGGVSVQRETTTQSIPDAVITTVTFDTEDRDDLGAYDAGTPTRVTAPTTGWYTLTGYVGYMTTFTGYKTVELWVNGAFHIAEVLTTETAFARGTICTSMYLAAGDYVQLRVFQDSTGAQAANARLTMMRH